MNSANGVKCAIIKTDMVNPDNIPENLDLAKMPRHVAMIMDGNGRWAKQRGLPRSAGHAEGVSTVRRVTELSSDLGIKFLTLYAFSTENWNRPQEEVETIMTLIGWAIEQELPDLLKNNVRLLLIGNIDRIPEGPRTCLENCRRATAHCTGLSLALCLSYSAHDEITSAARTIAGKVAAGQLDVSDINEDLFASHLQTSRLPYPDLLIRTGGEERLSNFLLWQVAYSELYFTDTLWPDFSKEDYARALRSFQNRERRFGKTSEQVTTQTNS